MIEQHYRVIADRYNGEEIKLEDLHARWHDQPGNMLGRDECGWDGCEFYAAAEFTLTQDGSE